MDYYVLINRSIGAEVHRFTEQEFFKAKKELNPETIQYVSSDLNSVPFKLFDTIVWKTLYNPVSKRFHKILVSKDIQNPQNMEKEAAEKIRELTIWNDEKIRMMKEERDLNNAREILKHSENTNNEEFAKITDEMNTLIPMNMNEADALVLWVKSGFKRPAGNRITQIKNSFDMNWWQFTDFIKENIKIN